MKKNTNPGNTKAHQKAAVKFFWQGGAGGIFCQGAGGGLFARAAQKAPCVYRIPLGPHVLCGHSREFCEKRGFRKIPLRGGGHPGRQHIPPTPPASPVEPERGQGGLARNFETPQITERLGLGVEPEQKGGGDTGRGNVQRPKGLGLESGNKKGPEKRTFL